LQKLIFADISVLLTLIVKPINENVNKTNILLMCEL